MFLKTLSLRGFKTFPDQTDIEFGPDSRVTGIVGPNGCGKSNVLDAVRWVLGEDNPRMLRVGSLDNIIFAGTAQRKPLSLAEVTLTFDNSSGRLPVPFTEVAIKRRTFREGESEFYINKNQCRLKDIRDLLLDTGLGEGTYAIITQGQVDAILSSKGEERRVVFEEAAGINKYKTRKVAAEKKLIAAEQNLLRINDLKIEVGEHLIVLEEQARRAKEYLEIQNKVKELEIGLSKKLLGSILEKKQKLEAALAQARQESQAKSAAEEKDFSAAADLKKRLREIESQIDDLAAQLDSEKDRLRDAELNRRFKEKDLQREQELLLSVSAKKAELAGKVLALQTPATNDPAQVQLDESLHRLVDQTRGLVALLSSILQFFGKEENLSLAASEAEATRNLKLELLNEEHHKAQAEMERLSASIEAHRQDLLAVSAPDNQKKTSLSDAIAQLKVEREKTNQQIAQLEEKSRQEEQEEREAANIVASLEVSLAKVDGELLAIGEKLLAEYNLSLQDLEGSSGEVSNVSKAKSEIEEGKSRLRHLEPVNLLAIEDFDRNKERLSFIEAQLTDLNAARENLRNLIVELDAQAETTFLQTMDQLSVVFSDVFSQLFSGGEARIALAPGQPALEAEIEISVRPNGRRWLPLPLLSGGERSLCAVAILFSLLKIRPSPFCFLDEVDAALDEANIGRYTNILKDFSANTQVIVITHNKRTMAIADSIYGVTMQDPGTSKVLSMKLAQVPA
ncbi:MAG: AAA family ATPase [Candidatus Margulisbacteria bacterium]|nr:AAA family ATPase [Candidatus Margulisiibacteriota bacterium]